MKFFQCVKENMIMEYQFIEFTKNIINNYKNRSYLILNETIESNFTSLWTVINTNIIDFIKDPIELTHSGECGLFFNIA